MSAEPAPVEKSAPEVGTMRKGDYMIHVYLQEGKQFKNANGDMVSPMIQITVSGKAKYTTVKKEITPSSSVYWGEHLFFERNNMSKNEIESAQIQIRVLNKGLLRDELIGNIKNFAKRYLGTYDFDVTFIYFQDKHTLFNQWIALSNPEGKDFNEITCYLKLAISVAGPGDEQVQINDETAPKNQEDIEIMMPPSIRKEYKQLKIRFIKAEKLPLMDSYSFGTIDAYVQTTYMKKKLKTNPVTQTKNTAETFIEQEFWLPIQWPLASDRLVLKIYDYDKGKNDEIVGSMNFSLKQLIESSQAAGEDGIIQWHNIYGSPLGCSGENTDNMNEYPEIASTWKGRILIQTTCVDTKNPEMKSQPIDAELKNKLMKQGVFELNEWEFLIEYITGISLPAAKKYKLRLQINDFTNDSPAAVEFKGTYNRWSQRTAVTTFKGPYKTIQELGRVYIYLLDGDVPICFWQGLASEFLNPNAQQRWLPMQADLALGKVKNNYEAGLISVKLSINHKQKNGAINFAVHDAWKKPPPKRLSAWKIRCFIFQCKDIPSADSDGASDPYISVWNPDNKVIKTSVIEDNINPIFFEALEIYYDFEKIENAPPIVLNIWDQDDLLDADDYLGRCVVYLKDAATSDDNRIPEPKWHDIRIGFSDSEPPCGQMLVSFSVVVDDYSYKIPINYLKLTDEIEYRDFNCEINILGLRNLESFGLMPVKKPFIKFNLRSLLPPEKAQAVTNIKTQPSSAGNNPNINTMISFAIDLPVNPLFCPKLQCDVYDYVYKGLVQPLLGTFTLSIGDIMHTIRRERKEEIEESDQIIAFLKDYIKKLDEEGIVFQDKDGQNVSFFDKNVNKLNQMYDNSQLMTEGSQQVLEKAKLIEEGGPETFRPSLLQKDEESKSLLPNEAEAEESQLVGRRTPTSPFTSTTPNRDLTPDRMNRKKTGIQMFKKQVEGQKLTQEISLGLNIKVLIEKQKQKEIEMARMQQERINDLNRLKSDGDAHRNVLFPKYAYDDRLKIQIEVLPKPPTTLYYEVGYDKTVPETPEERQKHYRRFYDDELENIKEIFPKKPFHEADVIRGQSRGLSKGWFSFFVKSKTDDSGQVTNLKKVGYFKGKLTIENSQEKALYKKEKETRMQLVQKELEEIHRRKFGTELLFKPTDLESFEQAAAFEYKLHSMGIENPSILMFLKEQSYEEMIARMLLQKTRCLVRLYVLEGFDMAQRDIGSFSDPYLKIKCGQKKFNERDSYQLDEPNPKFHKFYEFDAEFPGASPIVIKAMDYDDLFGDDLIGKTIIDLDDRFFCPEWQQIEDKPIEYRQLHHPSTEVSQGVIKCWVEIHPCQTSTKGNPRNWDVTPEPILDYEARLVVYDTKETLVMDVEDVSDVFIKAYIDDKDKKETDCHYRAQNKKASFNYRLVYNLKAPRKNYNLTLQTWDRDLFKSNDFIGEIQLPLQDVFNDCIQTQKPINVNKKYYDQFWKGQLEKLGKDKVIHEFPKDDPETFWVKTFDKDGGFAGYVRLGLSIFPGEMAKSNPVGGGRAEPNHSPFLPPPVGRIFFTLNPFTLFFQFVGPELRRKIYVYCCLITCLLFCIAIFPMVFSNLISEGLVSIFKK